MPRSRSFRKRPPRRVERVELDHFGLSLAVAFGPIPQSLAAAVRRRRPEADPETLVAAGWDGARQMISQYVEAGLSKFVVRPVAADGFEEFLAGFVRELMPAADSLARPAARVSAWHPSCLQLTRTHLASVS